MYQNKKTSPYKLGAIGFGAAIAVALAFAACNSGSKPGSAAARPNVYMAQLTPLNGADNTPIGIAQVTQSNGRLDVHVTASAEASHAMQIARIHSGSCDAVTNNLDSNVSEAPLANAITVALDGSSADSGIVNGEVAVASHNASDLGQDIIVMHSVVNGTATPIACGRLQTTSSPSPSPSASASGSPSASPSASASASPNQSQGQSQSQVQTKATPASTEAPQTKASASPQTKTSSSETSGSQSTTSKSGSSGMRVSR